jgi:hypothetical protein
MPITERRDEGKGKKKARKNKEKKYLRRVPIAMIKSPKTTPLAPNPRL